MQTSLVGEKVIAGRKKSLLREKCIVLTMTQKFHLPKRQTSPGGPGSQRFRQRPNFSRFFMLMATFRLLELLKKTRKCQVSDR